MGIILTQPQSGRMAIGDMIVCTISFLTACTLLRY
jgi:hypothetical protein